MSMRAVTKNFRHHLFHLPFLRTSGSFAQRGEMTEKPEEWECVPVVMLRFLLRCSLQSSKKNFKDLISCLTELLHAGEFVRESEQENGQGYVPFLVLPVDQYRGIFPGT